MAKPGNIVAGKYRLERMLGRGGMGSVWLARHLQLDAPVAVKLLDACRNPDARARFEREARAAARIRTAHVAQIHDQGVGDGVPYIVMEFLEGEDLGARLHREGRLGLRAAASLATQIARALRLAHEAGIVHRDLKPTNVFIARTPDDEEVVKVLDFGIAKDVLPGVSGDITATGVLLGTLRYMSPEQLRDPRSADARSDVWSLGVIVFLALTGREPFAGGALGESVVKICSDPIPRASDVAPGLPPAVDAFFERALARDPAIRFQTAPELAEALERVVRDEEDDIAPTRLLAAQSWVGTSSSPGWTRVEGSRAQTALLPCVDAASIPPAPPSSYTPMSSSWTPVPPSYTPMPSSYTPMPGSLAPMTRPPTSSLADATSLVTDASASRGNLLPPPHRSRSRRAACLLTAVSVLALTALALWARPLARREASAPAARAAAPAAAPPPTSMAPEAPDAPEPLAAPAPSASASASANARTVPPAPAAASAKASTGAKPIRVITSAL